MTDLPPLFFSGEALYAVLHCPVLFKQTFAPLLLSASIHGSMGPALGLKVVQSFNRSC